ncbi:EAL domain-containing protein [Martelella sp. HB161492]|uniref:EAL domain-containing protein n=1 Tax=Martelella sp. HB161492 TaxID=2720726 RepID=UPI00159251F0
MITPSMTDPLKRLLRDNLGFAAPIVERSPIGFALVDSESLDVLGANKSFHKLFLELADDTSGLLAAIHPEDRIAFTRFLRKASNRDDRACSIVTRLDRRERDSRSVLAIAARASFPESAPSPRSILLYICELDAEDILERDAIKRAKRWNFALMSSGLGVWDHNYRTGEKFYSPTWHQMRGLSASSSAMPYASTEDWLNQLHPDDRLRVRYAIEQQQVGNPAFMNFEYREKHANGHYIWIECRGDAVEFYDNGRPSRIIGTDRDITESKEAEALLKSTTRKLELALETSQIGVFDIDATTRDGVWDERMLKIYGIADHPDTVSHDRWRNLTFPEDVARINRHGHEGEPIDVTVTDDYRIYREDDKAQRHIHSRMRRYRTEDGEERVIGVNWDVTEEARLRQELLTAKQLAEARNFELDRARSDVEHAVLHDYLTGLPNRNYLEAELQRRLEIASANTTGIALLHIDIFGFKSINDTHGHVTGDNILRSAASMLRFLCRHNDFVARVSGDEFIMIANYKDDSAALVALARRIIAELSKPVRTSDGDERPGGSIGIALSEVPVALSATELMQNADIALLRAKSMGRNCVALFDSIERQRATQEKARADALLRAIDRDEFIPFYQPQFDASTGRISGIEVLARWRKPDGTVASADSFIPLADALNAMGMIDARILETAVKDHKRFVAEGLKPPHISVNLTPRRLSDPALIDSLIALGVTPGMLTFELLESTFLDRYDDTCAFNLKEFGNLGIAIEVDDFGTGYTSIVSLLKVAPSALKIARELIFPLVEKPDQRQIVKAIVDIAQALGIRVIAEGVETEKHAEILRSLGCDALQGFALARPVPADTLETLLRNEVSVLPAP